VQRDALERVERLVGAVDARGRGDALELLGPAPHRGESGGRIGAPKVEIERRVEHELAADEPARVIARGVIVVGAQVVGGAIAQLARTREIEQRELGAAARVAVADHHHGVLPDQHLVVPGAARVDVGAERVDRGNRLETADFEREEPAAAQDHQMLAVQLDDAALVDAGVLDVGDGIGQGGRRAGGRRLHRFRPALGEPALMLLGPALEQGLQLGLAGKGFQGAFGRGGVYERHERQNGGGEGETKSEHAILRCCFAPRL
jgi:hypothetical protein